MTADIFFFYSETVADATQRLRAGLRTAAAERGWGFVERRAERTKLVPDRRSISVLPIPEAKNVYERVHKVPVGVFVVEPLFVRRDPARAEPTERQLTPLETFLKYKAHFCHATLASPPNDLLAAFSEWTASLELDDSKDPRCLPLQTFEARVPVDLSSAASRKEFDDAHRSRGGRRDACDDDWEVRLDPTMHGGVELVVRTHKLPRGFHWDLQTSGSRRLCTHREVWQVPRGEYVNVSPNAHVRGNAKWRVYPR